MLSKLFASLCPALWSSSYDDTRTHYLEKECLGASGMPECVRKSNNRLPSYCHAMPARTDHAVRHTCPRVLTVPAQVPLPHIELLANPCRSSWANNNLYMLTATAPSLHSLQYMSSPVIRHDPTSDWAKRESQCSRLKGNLQHKSCAFPIPTDSFLE